MTYRFTTAQPLLYNGRLVIPARLLSVISGLSSGFVRLRGKVTEANLQTAITLDEMLSPRMPGSRPETVFVLDDGAIESLWPEMLNSPEKRERGEDIIADAAGRAWTKLFVESQTANRVVGGLAEQRARESRVEPSP